MEAEVTEDTLTIKLNHANPKTWLPVVGCLFPFCALPAFLYGWFQYDRNAFYLGLIACAVLLLIPLNDHLRQGSTKLTFNRHHPTLALETTRYLNRKLQEVDLTESHLLYQEANDPPNARRITLTLHGDHDTIRILHTTQEGTDPNPTADRIVKLVANHVPHLPIQSQQVT